MEPVVYILCGLAASGKSTYAQKLAKTGLRKLSLDEEVYQQYGRVGVDYPASRYLHYYKTVQIDLEYRLVELLRRKESAVLDYGFWRRSSRDHHKQLIEGHGIKWRLIYFKASPEVLINRLEARNKRTDADAFPVTKEMLHNFIMRFEEPLNEGEEIIEQR